MEPMGPAGPEKRVAEAATPGGEGRLASVEAAREAILAAVGTPLAADVVPLERALGRVAATPIRAVTDLPPWDNSAMDGYAVRSGDVRGAGEDDPVRLPVVGEVAAGAQGTAVVEPGTAVRIATGAPVPPGADAVVPVELTTPLDPDGRPLAPRGSGSTATLPAAVLVHQAVPAGGSIRRRGEDVARGDLLLEAGEPVTPAAIALLAGAGVARVSVHRRPRVAVLVTGDELRAPGEELGPAGIFDANGPALRALVRQSGAIPLGLGIARDNEDAVVARLEEGIAVSDVVIVSGGVSVGPYDVVKAAFQRVGQVALWRVAIQPGKPFAFGRATAPDGHPVLLFGLPGNPVSVFVTFEVFVRPALRALAGERLVVPPLDRGILLDDVTKSRDRRAFLRVRAERGEDGAPRRDPAGRVLLRLAGGQGSHVLSALARADGLAVVPEGLARAEAGMEVGLWWLAADLAGMVRGPEVSSEEGGEDGDG
jgi:molybdopterin molybdotransferase